ncbi:MAG: DMT family transporter [Janthinobacterium lividum]
MALATRQPQHGLRNASPETSRDSIAAKRPGGRLQSARSRALPATVAATASKPDRTVVGILALLVSVALFPVSDIASKMLTATLPGIEVAWMRYLVFVVMTVPLLLRDRSLLRATRPGLLAGRAIASAASTALFIVAFGMMPVANATAIGFLAPVVVTAMAALFLREKVGLRRWSAALVGLVGVIVIVQPGGSSFTLASFVPLCGSIASALAIIGTRLARDERPETTMLYQAVVGFAVVTVLAAFDFHLPSWNEVAIGCISGFFATLASLMQVFAYRHAPASLLSPFSYTQLLWAAGLGFMAFGTVPGPSMLAGAAIITASGIYTAWRETVRAGEA